MRTIFYILAATNVPFAPAFLSLPIVPPAPAAVSTFSPERSLQRSSPSSVVVQRALNGDSELDATTLKSYRRSSDFDGDLLRRPGMESWMFDEDNKLKDDQIKFDWREVSFRDDQLGGYDPDLTPRVVDGAMAPVLAKLEEVFGNTIKVLEASEGVFRFQYYGPVKNQIGMEAWALDLLKTHHPQPDTIKECSFLTKRKRDLLFHDKV